MTDEGWLELDENRTRKDGQPLSPGVYEVQIEEGVEGTQSVIRRLHLTDVGWYQNGVRYRNPFARFAKCRRIGDLPD